MERGDSQRQACELIELPRSILKYRPVRAERDAPALIAMRRIAATYPRYGYRRVRIFLRREGHAMSAERLSTMARRGLAIAPPTSGAAIAIPCDRIRASTTERITKFRQHYDSTQPGAIFK